MSDGFAPEPELIHRFKNHLSIVLGFSELLLASFPEDDPRHGDILEVRKSARAALDMLPELASRLQRSC
jgi:hypothetical protein